MNTPEEKPDAVQMARILLHQLASLRAESIQTQSIVTQILCHVRDETHQKYLERIAVQEKRKADEVDRIYRASLELAKIPYQPIPDAGETPSA